MGAAGDGVEQRGGIHDFVDGAKGLRYAPDMLQTLRIRNFAIVDALEVEFARGLNVITGETGAGKSVLIGALGLLLGARSDRSQIRAGVEQCAMEAVFELEDADAVNLVLDELGLPATEDGRLIVRRIVSATGAGKQLINDSATTLQGLKRLGDLLVDLHGPHEHQSLLNVDFQLDLLDSFGHLAAARAPYERAYEQMLELASRRRALEGDDKAVAQQLDLLKYQIKEIEEAELEGLSEESLTAEHALLANAQEILTLGQAASAALTETEESAFNRLVEGRRFLDQLARLTAEAAPWQAEAEAVAVQLQALSTSLQRRLQDIELNPERLQWLEDRMALLHRLKRKYGATLAEIQAFLEDARGKVADLSSRAERLAALDRESLATTERLRAAGGKLGQARRKAARALGEAVTEHLHDLGFPHGQFAVELTEAAEPRPSGLDQIEFGFAPNLGEPMRPLRQIASSGEISRVMLATKSVLARHDRVPVLVFDEVDANVGGEMGVAIGAKLAAVAADHQVICITHLPQVAARGSTHFAVSKRVDDGRTHTTISQVSGPAREEEVARMLGGKDLTSVALRHARELLASGKTAG